MSQVCDWIFLSEYLGLLCIFVRLAYSAGVGTIWVDRLRQRTRACGFNLYTNFQ